MESKSLSQVIKDKKQSRLDSIKSGKARTAEEPKEILTTPTYHIVSQKYFVTRLDGKTYLLSWLNCGTFGQIYNLTKSNSDKPATVERFASGAVKSVTPQAASQLTQSEFESILNGKPKWNELQRAYSAVLVDPSRIKLNTDSPVVVW